MESGVVLRLIVCAALAAGTIFAAPVQAGVTVTADTSGVQTDTIICGQPVQFRIALHNSSGEGIQELQHGFRLYSPNGATWQPVAWDTAGGLGQYADSVHTQGYSVTGSGADTVSLQAFCERAGRAVVPNGYDDVVLTLTTQVDPSQAGKTLCLDSAWFPPSGVWKWATTGGDMTPSWSGPKCVNVVPHAILRGTVWNDINRNGAYNAPPESGIPLATVHLAGPETQATTTWTDGTYSFVVTTPGTYRVWHDVPTGMLQTYPSSVLYFLAVNMNDVHDHLDFGDADTTCPYRRYYDTCRAGTHDNFVGPEASSPSPELLAWMNLAYGGANPYFDSPCTNQGFGHTFTGCWHSGGLLTGNCVVTAAKVCMHLKATGSVPRTDYFCFADYASAGAAWSISLNNLIAYATGGADTHWDKNDELTVCLDLANLPQGSIGPSNILALLRDGDLDIGINDDTECDYFDLFVETCCDAVPCDLAPNIFPFVQKPGGTPGVVPDTSIAIKVNLNNCTGEHIIALAHGFALYSPDGATWEVPTFDIAGDLQAYMDGGVALTTAGVDGTGVDSVGISAFALMQPGLPNGYDDVILTINTRVNSDDIGKHLCIDSLYFPSPDSWNWELDGSGSAFPGWDGPQCWEIIPAPTFDTAWAFGLEHVSDGWTDLAYDGETGRLTAGALGFGEIAFSANLPEQYHAYHAFVAEVDSARNLPEGAQMEWTFRGTVGGVPDQVVGQMFSTKLSDSVWQIAVATEADSYTLQILNAGQLVHEETGFTGEPWNPGSSCRALPPRAVGVVDKVDVNPLGDYAEDYAYGETEDYSFEIFTWRIPRPFYAVGGSGPYVTDEVRLITENVTPNISGLTGVTVTTQDIPTVVITNESSTLGYRGLECSTIGDAVLQQEDTTLAVVNTTPYGDLGVAVDLGKAERFDAVLRNPDLEDTLPVGASFAYATTAVIDGVIGQPVMSVTHTKVGSHQWGITVDSDAPSYTVEIYLGDTLLHRETGYTGGGAKVPYGFGTVELACPEIDVHGTRADPFARFEDLTYGLHTVYEILGVPRPPFVCDRIRIIPEYDVPAPHAGWCGLTLTGHDVPGFTIDFLGVGSAGCCVIRGDVNHSGNGPDISDLVHLVNYMFKSGPAPVCFDEADVNATGTLDISDLVYLVNYMFKSGLPPVLCSEPPVVLSKVLVPSERVRIEEDRNRDGTTVYLASDLELAGLQFEVVGPNGSDVTQLVNQPGDLVYGWQDGILKVGLLDLTGQESIPAGRRPIARISGDCQVTSALAVDLAIRTIVPTIGVARREAVLPHEFALEQNYPNPFNPATAVAFSLPRACHVELTIYNVLGQAVETLLDTDLQTGRHQVTWHARECSSGVYFYRLEAGDFGETKKMLLLK